MSSRSLVLVVFSFCLISVEGCLTTLVRVETTPPGAQVHYDYQPQGVTPTEFEVDWYGKHRLTLDHPEFGRRVEDVHLKAPAYLTFPMDFFTAILPFKVVDRHTIEIDLSEDATSNTEEPDHESEGTQQNNP
ncbi:MAG: PEGA domain-containing protein [Candidatus Hinthialibacter antarcticus]|nr:PEGA domain-containing protein [Candidatus Hinthialibacter antarcticus]